MQRQEISSTVILLAIGALSGYLVGLSVQQSANEAPPPHHKISYSGELCPVMRVVDGDTITVWINGAVEPLRLLNIDTPEMGEYGYFESTAALKELVGRGPVRLEGERPGELVRDSFGRLLAYVYLGDTCVNVEMVRLGWSEYYSKFGEGRLKNCFKAAEAEAKEAGRGLWRRPG